MGALHSQTAEFLLRRVVRACYQTRIVARRGRGWGLSLGLAGLGAAAACALPDAVPAECVEDADCPEELSRCHVTAKVCVVDCASGDACPAGESCSRETGLCGCRPEDDGCPGGTVCHVEDRICVVPGCEGGCPEERGCCEASGLCLSNASRCEPGEGPP